MGVLFIALGLLSIAAAVFNWSWFMESRRSRFISGILTPTGARIFYLVLGLGIVLGGALDLLGYIGDK